MIVRVYLILFITSLGTYQSLRSQNVNPFTGDFSHSTPLLVVPSPDGPEVTIGAGYGAGIGVGQGASEIGLGWGLSAGGAITRGASGVPDDFESTTIINPQTGAFEAQGGLNRSGNKDMRSTRYKVCIPKLNPNQPDTAAFSFPDYDIYSVGGPGIVGQLIPNLFEYTTTDMSNEPYQMNTNSKKLVFHFAGDFADTLIARHYQTTPVTGSDNLNFPGANATYNGVTNTDPYTGAKGRYVSGQYTYDGYDKTTRRLWSSKYVEYLTNTEVNTALGSSTSGMINFKTGETRSSTNYVMDGIGAFRVTNESGFVYHYSLPVYINYSITGNYPLDNDYEVPSYVNRLTTANACTTGCADYKITCDRYKNSSNSADLVVEYKEDKKYAYAWLLTAITGPDYVDANNNHIVDADDKGYWVSYDYQLWTKNFNKRTPQYGFNYSFAPDLEEYTQDDWVDRVRKVSGKFASFNLTNQEIYYLSKIQTSSHTAILVRDLRLDEHSSLKDYDNMAISPHNIGQNSGYTEACAGTLYDPQGPDVNYVASATAIDHVVDVSTSGANSIEFSFSDFDVAVFGANQDAIDIYYGGTYLKTFTQADHATWSTPTGNNAVTVRFRREYGDGTHRGFAMHWKAKWTTTRPKATPQLRVSRIVLMRNEEFKTLPALSVMKFGTTTPWDSTNTKASDNKFYNERWYAANQTAIQNASLKTIEFSHDYSLARNYHANMHMLCASHKFTSPTIVQNNITCASGQYANSGKLTLNRIYTYEDKHTQLMPSVVFDYNAGVSGDNPDYDPRKTDYWGFYKSDATTDGYSSYTTASSAPNTDAWSLRKITSPLGGTVEVDYESDRYENVFDERGGYKTPERIYMIKTATVTSGTDISDWTYTMEDNVQDFDDLRTSIATVPNLVFIPCATKDTTGVCNLDHTKYYVYGSITNSANFTSSRVKGFTTGVKSIFYNYSSPPQSLLLYNNLQAFTPASGLECSNVHQYTGNGYISYKLPANTTVYGGGIRVKTLTTKNSTIDTYKQEYTYEGGVTPVEPDRFETIRRYKDYNNALQYYKLLPFDGNQHRMGPEVGYTKVTIKSTGQNNVDNGSTVSTFITSDAGVDNFKANVVRKIRNLGCNSANDTSYVIEVVDKFSELWGQVKENMIYDVNNNMIARSVNEYQHLTQGAEVEYFHFVRHTTPWYNPVGMPCIAENKNSAICIMRNYPTVLTKTTNYSKGLQSVTQMLRFDEVTGAPTTVMNTEPNGGLTVARTRPAFRVSDYANMGPKSQNSAYRNILSATAESKVTKDSTLSGTADFLSYGINTWTKDFTRRRWNQTNSKFENYTETDDTKKFWTSVRNYSWIGATSTSSHGLYKASELSSAAFDYTLAAVNSKWRFNSQDMLFDPRGHLLEERTFNNRFMAKKYSHHNKYVAAEVSGCNYASFTFCAFEDTMNVNTNATPKMVFDGEVEMGSGLWAVTTGTVVPHTGTGMVKLTPNTSGAVWKSRVTSGQTTCDSLSRGRRYRASVWVHTSSPNNAQLVMGLDGTNVGSPSYVAVAKNDASATTIGNWVHLTAEIDVPGNYLSSGGSLNDLRVYLLNPSGSGGDAYFDDLMVHPIEAGMSASVNDARTGRVMATLDNYNFATVYKYDDAGRITEVWQEIAGKGLVKVKQNKYNYARGVN